MEKEQVKGHLSIAAAYTIFGLNVVLCKDIANSAAVPPVVLFTFRAIGASALFWLLSFFLPKERIEKGDMGRIALASFLGLNKIGVLSLASDIDALVRRRLLRYRDVKDEDDFDIPTIVIRYLKHNEVYQLPKRTGLDCAGLFELLNLWFEDLSDDAISPRELTEELKQLYTENPQVGNKQIIMAGYADDDLLLP